MKLRLKLTRIEGKGMSTVLQICTEALKKQGWIVYIPHSRADNVRILEKEEVAFPEK